MIPLMKNAFTNEHKTKKLLAEFITSADKLSMGDKCFKFEKEFSIIQETKHSILFNSGGSANLALLQTLKNLNRLKNNSKVGFSALTWSTNVMPIIQLGMIPVAIDCEPTTLNTMSKNILDTLKYCDLDAIFITNVLGFSGDLEKIRDICESKKIVLIEDNCEALGTKLPSGRTGNFGLASSFSFFVAHHMSTIEGGMICTQDDEIAQMLRMVRANGWDRNLTATQQNSLRSEHSVKSEFQAKYTFYDLGFNFRPTEITGFIGLEQLKFLESNIKKRRDNHIELDLQVKKNLDLISIQHSHIKDISPFAFPIICKDEEKRSYYCQQFAGSGIEIRPMIAGNIQNQPFYKKYVDKSFSCPGADFLHNNSFYCGNYPELNTADLELIKSCLFRI